MNSFEVLLPCIACAVKPVSNEDLVAAARPINPCGEKLGYDSRALLTMVHSSTSLVKALPILISLHTCSVMSSVRPLIPFQGLQLRFCIPSRSRVALVLPPMGSESSTPFPDAAG